MLFRCGKVRICIKHIRRKNPYPKVSQTVFFLFSKETRVMVRWIRFARCQHRASEPPPHFPKLEKGRRTLEETTYINYEQLLAGTGLVGRRLGQQGPAVGRQQAAGAQLGAPRGHRRGRGQVYVRVELASQRVSSCPRGGASGGGRLTWCTSGCEQSARPPTRARTRARAPRRASSRRTTITLSVRRGCTTAARSFALTNAGCIGIGTQTKRWTAV